MAKQLRNLVNGDELKKRMRESTEPRTTLSFYQYHQIADPQAFRDRIYAEWSELGVLGRIYVGREGINGQVSVPTPQLEAWRDRLYAIPFLNGIRLNIAVDDDGKSFFKLTIKVRDKIVADGLDDHSFDVTRRGRHLSAAEVNELLDQPGTLVVDMRNHYESEVGHFQGAILPDVETFREALPIVEDMLAEDKDKDIIMYCTGGIRCEKASAYYLHRGFSKVHMIDGGIIEYARQCAENGLENKYIGKNFVFDERLGERITDDVIARCHQCGAPCDEHTNCANEACHALFIQCPACAERYHGCCDEQCAEFVQLPEEEQRRLRPTREFRGQRVGKGRYEVQ
jgi:UPF0176 protein